MTPIYDSGAQGTKVRALLWFSLLCAAGSTWAGVFLARNFGLSPADGGVLAPLPVRLAWAVGVSSIGLAFLAGMLVYVRCYAARVAVDDEERSLHVSRIGLFGGSTLVVPAERVLGSEYHPGQADYGGVAVNAAWDTVRVEGRRLPLILDAQGDVLDPERAGRFLGI